MADESADTEKSKNLNDLFSREKVAELPHFMAMLGYLSQTYGIPRYGFRNKSLRYHYTDATGLLGILMSNRVWATDARFLNDPSEGHYLPQKLLQIFESRERGKTSAAKVFLDGVRNHLAHPRDQNTTFCISFCANGDLLSQWRWYGSFGRGYALGFELDMKPHFQIGGLYDVCYGDGPLELMADDLLDIYLAASEKWGTHMSDDISAEAAALFRTLAWQFKDPNYSEEQESRIIIGRDNRKDYLFEKEAPIHFRAKGGDIVPYIPLAFDPIMGDNNAALLPIKEIIVGPGVDFERSYASIGRLLADNDYEGVQIRQSAIPFRG